MAFEVLMVMTSKFRSASNGKGSGGIEKCYGSGLLGRKVRARLQSEYHQEDSHVESHQTTLKR